MVNLSRKENESSAMTQMVDRYRGDKKTIFIADRGYETYNIFAHVQEKGMYYMIRDRPPFLHGGDAVVGAQQDPAVLQGEDPLVQAVQSGITGASD